MTRSISGMTSSTSPRSSSSRPEAAAGPAQSPARPAHPLPAVDPNVVAWRLDGVRARVVAAGGDLDQVRVLAVTKGFGLDAVSAAVALGLDVGENYAQELLGKACGATDHPAPDGPSQPGAPRWHFLGALQRRKVRDLAAVVSQWDSVCRTVEGLEIARRRPGARVLVQVDTTGIPGRNGCPVAEVAGVVAELRRLDLDVAGLMAVAPRDPEGARSCFRSVRQLADQLELEERSIGMSDDLELAVVEGSTTLRLGRALFGDRVGPGGTP